MLKTYLLHNTLVQRPDLLPGILRYSGPVIPNVSELEQALTTARMMKMVWVKLQHAVSSFVTSPTHDQCFQNAKKIFSRMVNIQDLRFTDEVGQWSPELWDTFATAKSNRNIERLSLRVHGDYPFLISILRAQPRLKHLDIARSGGTRVEGLQSTDLQELKSLRAILSEAAIFVPGRPIKKLELLHYEVGPFFLDHEPNPVEVHFKNLERSTCDITDLTLRLQSSWGDDVSERNLRFAIRYLPRIERLSLVVHGMLSEDIVSFIHKCPLSLDNLTSVWPFEILLHKASQNHACFWLTSTPRTDWRSRQDSKGFATHRQGLLPQHCMRTTGLCRFRSETEGMLFPSDRD